MKFSVLLPTRNGGRFLKNCICSILDQNYSELELVISDNANTDETPQIIHAFADDKRLKALRLEKPVSVTDNWNNALNASSGDYILMMGDDDYLLPGYFHKMEAILDKYSRPDCVVHNAYSYVAPGSIGDNKQSFYSEAHFQFGPDFVQEHKLGSEQRFSIVRDIFRFKVRIPLNMQTTLIGRRALGSIRGGVFQPPFPDHYALNSLLLTAENWVFSPEKLLVVGVSPKSFGHYVYSNRQGSGLDYLGITADFKGRLPGNELMNGMHVWLNLLKRNYPELLKDVEVDRAGYVRRQVYAWYMQYKLGAITAGDFLRSFGLLSFSDRVRLLTSVTDKASWKRLLRVLSLGRKSDAETLWHGLQPLEGIADIQGFAQWLAGRSPMER